jgi:cytoskeletal protein RodZ
MSINAKNIGESFRVKREEMSLSLKEVENATSIRKNFLEAIEKGNIDQYISDVYAKGFVKQYANFLGFNGEEVLQKNFSVKKQNIEKQDFSYGVGTLEMRNSGQTSSSSPSKFKTNFLYGGLFLLVLIIAWYFAKFLGVV